MGTSAGGTPRLGRGPVGDELGLGRRDRRAVEEGHGRVSVGQRVRSAPNCRTSQWRVPHLTS